MLSRLFCVVCKCGAFAAEFTLYALFVGEICSCVFISSLFVFFWRGGVSCRYAYFHHLPQEDLPYIKVPLHTVIKLTPKAYGCDEERFVFFIR